MNLSYFRLAALACLIITLTSCQEPSLSEGEVLASMDTLESKLEWLEYRLPMEQWRFDAVGRADSLDHYKKLQHEVFGNDSLRGLIFSGKNLLTEEVDRRRHDLLLRKLLWYSVEGSARVRGLRDSIIGPGRNLRHRPAGTMRASYLLDGSWSSNGSQTLREQTFLAHFTSLDELSAGIGQIIRARNQAARRMGYSNFLSVAFGADNVKAEDMLQMVSHLESSTSAAYTSLLDELERRENVGALQVWDLGVSYASILSRINGKYPSEAMLSTLAASLDAIGFGLDTLPLYFDLRIADGLPPGARSYNVNVGREARIMLTAQADLSAIQDALAISAGALSFLGRDKTTTPLFARLTDPAWDEGMAALLGAFVYDSSWLAGHGGLSQEDAGQLKRLAAEQSLLELRLAITDFMFEYEAYKNPQRNLDRLWWDLFERYVKLPRHDGLFVWAQRPELVTKPFDIRDALLGQIIRCQTEEYFRGRYGTIVDNPEMRAFLQQSYFRFGGRYQWPQLLEHGTGQPLKPDFLVTSVISQ